MGRGQELLDAARKGDRSTVEKIIGQITKRSGPFPSIRRGPGVNVKDDNGYTPLHHACLNGLKDIVQLLLSAEASPCAVDKIGATPLHLATFNGYSEIVAMLLEHNHPPVNIDQLTQKHDTALLMAAEFGYTDIVSMLVSRGADVSIKNLNDMNALDLAAQFNKRDVVKLLLRLRPQLIDKYKTPVRNGVFFEHTPLHRASKHGREGVVRELLAAGVDPNLRTAHGTPLHEAACYARDSVVRLLLRKGADLNAQDIKGKTVMKMLAEFPEESTRSVRQVIHEFKSQRCSYDSEEDLPPFPVLDSPPAPMSLKQSPSFAYKQAYLSDSSEQTVTNASTPNFEPPSSPIPTQQDMNLSPDYLTDSELIIRTDSFLAKEKMIKKIVPFDDVQAGSKVFVRHCNVISEIKSINQALTSNTMNSTPSIKKKKLMESAVYENIVYKWPELDRGTEVSHGKIEKEYYKAEKLKKLSDLNSLEKKAKSELHREKGHFYGARINQVVTIKSGTSPNEYNGFKTNRSPDVNRDLKIAREIINNEFDTDKHVNSQNTYNKNQTPMKKGNSYNDFSRLNMSPKLERGQHIRHDTIDNELKNAININSQPKYNTFTKNTSRPNFEIAPGFRRETIDNNFKKPNTSNAKTFQYKFSKPQLDREYRPRNGTLDKECTSSSYTYIQNDSSSFKKKPRPLPKPKVTNEISDTIEKLNFRQPDMPSTSEQELYEELIPFSLSAYATNNTINSELIYENLQSNMPDDMKANMSCDSSESHYLSMEPNSGEPQYLSMEPSSSEPHNLSMEPNSRESLYLSMGNNSREPLYLSMEPVRRSLRKRCPSDFVSIRTDLIKTDRINTDRSSLSYDYVNFDEIRDFSFRDKKLARNLSIPNCFMFGEKPKSMHIRGASGCLFESYDYLSFYDLNPRAERENVDPFIKKKEKSSPMPCYCSGLSKKEKGKPDIDNSQVLYYSCENMADDDTDYCSVDEVHLFDQCGTDDSVFTPLDESNASSSTEQPNGPQLERRLTGIFKKKVTQLKQLVTDW